MSPRIDLTGQVFGDLTVLGVSKTVRQNGRYTYDCQCACGNVVQRVTNKLKGKDRVYIHCGCKTKLNKSSSHGHLIKDLMGLKIGKLEVIGRCKETGKGAIWICKCICGKESKVKGYDLTKDNPVSACFTCRKTNKTHGLSHLPEYQVWYLMKLRCGDLNDKSYSNYGGRGIKVCDRWLKSFENFYEDMGSRPSKDYSIERLEVDGNYCLENCVWVLSKLQARNTTRNVLTSQIVNMMNELREEGLKFFPVLRTIQKAFPRVTETALYSAWKGDTWKSG